MARSSTARKTTPTSTTQLERQARRLARQSKHIEKEFTTLAAGDVKLTGARNRAIRFADIKRLEPLTDTQSDFFDSYEDGVEAFVLYGSAGTGKSFIGVYHALKDVLNEETPYEKLIIVRSTVQSRQQGFLPGSMEEKMEPFELPYHDICHDLTGRKDAYEKLKNQEKIEFLSTSFLRGSTFNNSIILCDEIQNLTWQELSTVMTRIGNDSRIIFCGDNAQNDLIHSKTDVSGFKLFVDITKKMVEFRHFRFTPDDIVRSGIVKSFLIQCENFKI